MATDWQAVDRVASLSVQVRLQIGNIPLAFSFFALITSLIPFKAKYYGELHKYCKTRPNIFVFFSLLQGKNLERYSSVLCALF